MSSSSASPPNVPKLAPFADTQPFRLTGPPNVGWKVGDGLLNTRLGRDWKTDEELGWKTWDMAQTSPSDATQMLNSTVVPRPIAFVSTLSTENKPNLAPFRYGTCLVAYHPPIVMNLISEPFAEAANETSVEAPADVSEWDISGLTQEPSVHVKPARVKESAVSLECELFQSQDLFPDGATVPSATLVLGRVKYMHIRHSLRAISRLGSTTYGRVSEGFDLKKPEWDEVKQILETQRSSPE
ncbi:hypothetical protein BJV77DRAFT_1058007 [Russula vinacea]|nr:hypothetical protein BJV77DRAFT_1058007 [Russula vinacea]